jgi:hypothetical protein
MIYTNYKGCRIEIIKVKDGIEFQCVSYNIGRYGNLCDIIRLIDKLQ